MEETNLGHDFSRAGFNDVFEASYLFKLLGVNSLTFIDPIEMSKLHDIAKFVNQYSGSIPQLEGIVRRNKSQTKPLDHIVGYIKLQQQKQAIKKQLDDVDNEIAIYE